MSGQPNPFAAHWQIRDIVVAAHIAAAGRGGLLFVGDSIVEGFYGSRIGPHPIVNAGYSGIVAEALARRLSHLIEAAKPRVVALLVGTNDAKRGCTEAQLEAFAVQYDAMAAALTASGSIPILITPPAVEPGKRLTNFYDADVMAEVARRIADAAARFRWPLVDLHGAFLGPDGRARPGMTIDGIHLSAAGYAQLRDMLERTIAHIGA